MHQPLNANLVCHAGRRHREGCGCEPAEEHPGCIIAPGCSGPVVARQGHRVQLRRNALPRVVKTVCQLSCVLFPQTIRPAFV